MILQVHNPNWGMQSKPQGLGCSCSGVGCSCGGQCASCRAGMGDFSSDPMGALMEMLSTPINLGFVSLPLWVVGGVAAGLAWWMLTPGGSDYRRARRQLGAKYRGSARLKRAASAAAGSLV